MFFAAYCPASLPPDAATSYALKLLARTKDCIREHSDILALARSGDELKANYGKGLISIFLAMENGAPIQKDLSLLRLFYDLGVRYVTLCHSRDNEICDSCSSLSPRWGGLSPFGREAVAEMNRIGMLIDVSHISDASFYDVLEYSSRPVVATHSCCRALADHPRNMSDDMIRALAAAGGVIQINFYPVFLSSEYASEYFAGGWPQKGDAIEDEFIADSADPLKRQAWYGFLDEIRDNTHRPYFARVVDHIDHVVELVGIDHVGIGSDFDGIPVTPAGLEDVSMVGKIFAEMKRRGYGDAEMEKVASGNFLRVMEAVEKRSTGV